ncbi:MAG: aminotransferase class I/II-fold pyridoxal phosphate-dependent enzyme [Alphaproteobacteria bacterium]|nr:aminotransferase class I/II-fold pyridoxal phosphate-dependent enzyme [Alphaproteobacteria bacterium]
MAGEAKARLLARLGNLPPRPTTDMGRPLPEELEGATEIAMLAEAAAALGIADPFFRPQHGIAGAETTIDGRRYLNFSSYDYLALNGDPRIVEAAKNAIDRCGTTVSASRAVSGERALHRELETALARWHGTEDAVALVSGHATNVSVIGSLFAAGDAIAHDTLAHNSIVEGARLSGARRLPFAHNDPEAADRALCAARPRRALIAIEGHYSMDGDVPDLAAFVAVARRHRAWLLVDDAHALGVLGGRGRGSAELAAIAPGDVDLWMGTLSKSLVSCGGYIAGSNRLIAYLKRRVPGFVFSVGIAPAAAAAALAALRILEAEPERVARLRRNAQLFLGLLRDGGIDTGRSIGAGIVPAVTGSSIGAARLAAALFGDGINVSPILPPAVPERAARLRFFVTAGHSEAQLRRAAGLVVEHHRAVAADPRAGGAAAASAAR